jgi:hypothetical protein
VRFSTGGIADTGESIALRFWLWALISITGKTASNAVATITTTRTQFETVIIEQRTLADAIKLREITTSGDDKALFGDSRTRNPAFPLFFPSDWTLTRRKVSVTPRSPTKPDNSYTTPGTLKSSEPLQIVERKLYAKR